MINKSRKCICIIGVLVICAIICVYINITNKNVVDYESLVYSYQLPNKLFVDSVHVDDKIDAFSTTSMHKIKKCFYDEVKDIEYEKLGELNNKMDAIYYLLGTEIDLTVEECKSYKTYIENIIKDDGLVVYAEQEEIDARLIYTLYVVKFAKQYNLEISKIPIIKDNIEERINNISNKESLFYISTMVQLAKELDVVIDTEWIKEYYNVKYDYFKENMINDAGGLMDLYYLSIIKNNMGIEDSMPIELQNYVMDCIYYSYTTMSLFYDSIYILKEYDLLETYKESIFECVKQLDERYLVEEEYYSLISTETPSLIATYSGLFLLKEEKVENEGDKKAIVEYLKDCIKDGTYSSFSGEELMCFYECVLLLDAEYASDEELVCTIKEQIISILEKDMVLSIREIYCIQQLCLKLGMESEELIKKKSEQTIEEYADKDMTCANLSMMLISEKMVDMTITDIEKKIDNISRQIYTIMDVYYFIELCNEFDYEIDKELIENVMINLRNEEGYYISKEQKENTMFTLYLGYNIDKYLN